MSEETKKPEPPIGEEVHRRARRLNKLVEDLAKAIAAVMDCESLTIAATHLLIEEVDGESRERPVTNIGTASRDGLQYRYHLRSIRDIAERLIAKQEAEEGAQEAAAEAEPGPETEH
jgi:hypothetical protein